MNGFSGYKNSSFKLYSMKHVIDTFWKGKMEFEAEIDGHKLTVDAGPESGGEDAGPRPKKLMLIAIAGCTGMDVVSLLKKMRVEIEGLKISVEADMNDEHPKSYTKMNITYSFKGKDLDMDKIRKAIELSQNKYCGVSESYRKGMDISWKIDLD